MYTKLYGLVPNPDEVNCQNTELNVGKVIYNVIVGRSEPWRKEVWDMLDQRWKKQTLKY